MELMRLKKSGEPIKEYMGSHIRAINFMRSYLTDDGSSMKRRTREFYPSNSSCPV